MLITNSSSIVKKVGFGKIIANYIIYEAKLPVLSIDGAIYYFNDNKRLRDELNKAPFWIRLLVKMEGKYSLDDSEK